MPARSKGLKKGQTVWMGNGFKEDGVSLKGVPAEVVSSYSKDKRSMYVVRVVGGGLHHVRVEEVITEDPSPAQEETRV